MSAPIISSRSRDCARAIITAARTRRFGAKFVQLFGRVSAAAIYRLLYRSGGVWIAAVRHRRSRCIGRPGRPARAGTRPLALLGESEELEAELDQHLHFLDVAALPRLSEIPTRVIKQ